MILQTLSEAVTSIPPAQLVAALVDAPRRTLEQGVTLFAQDIPDPPAKPIPGLEQPINDWIGYLKTACNVSAMIGLLLAAVMMGVGIRGRSDVAKSALSHAPWALGAAVLAGGSAELIRQFTGS
ncbi:hypothetical protein GCM10007304_14220 [Rhodococcoides trifolii]|uniref:Uncharacterized protein n=1 Tax=Rhodococcoides trifolii TaxID=908250 RepID=A0A917CX25_9NOCA|nr:hypothetical protein [Rhodococcus trifolii]GGG01404.1 hypothetical protein GCM10007304_14220 [Rhodococcus trifolii]